MCYKFTSEYNIIYKYIYIYIRWGSLQARPYSHYKAWSLKDYRSKESIYRQRIPDSSCARKETVERYILVTFRNGERKLMQSIRITGSPPSRKGSGTS